MTTTADHPVSLTAPELLAPAGDWDAMRAAVANGAGAVYFGLRGGNFNARYRATNFLLEELPEVMRYLHGHNVRGYVAFNTLIFSDELPEALRFVRAIAEAGADAVIVQDLGLARLIGRMCPGLHVHGSTQMTLTEPLGIEFVKRLGVRRVILARELSTQDIRRITAATDMPVEVFVHGALCVSYSGQCLTSEAIGGRSANRGQCAQACRLPYDLVVDGAVRDLGDKAYLLSPQDLAAHDLIGELSDIGVCSFKIEGRLKSPQYVAATTQTYRAAIDAHAKHQPFRISRQQELELAQSFSRGFSHGFLDGVNHQSLVHARFPKSRGVRVGTVAGRTPRGLLVQLERSGDRKGRGFAVDGELRVGDGVVFDEGHPEQDEQGGRIAFVSEVQAGRPHHKRGTTKAAAPHPRKIEITFDRGGVNLSAVSVGAIVWKTDDPAVRRRLEQSFARDVVARRIPLVASVSASIGERLAVTVRDDAGHEVTVAWDKPLEAAQKHPLTEQVFREQFGRMGDTPYELTDVRGLETPSGAMVPKSVMNDLRRQATEQLTALRESRGQFCIAEPDVLETVRAEIQVGAQGDTGLQPVPTVRQIDDATIANQQAPTQLARAGSPCHDEQQAPAALTRDDRQAPTPLARVKNPCHDGTALHVLVRTMDQLRAALRWRSEGTGLAPATVYCDFEDIRKYKEAVPLAREASVPVGLATVRIIKPGEDGLLNQVASCEPDLVLTRNLAGLSWFSSHAPHLPIVADYALNVANEVTASLLAEHGVARMVPSYDLSWREMAAMLGRFPGERFEAVIHQHMPMFHMEHCVFAHTLSSGSSWRDCGRPCDTHRVDLRDRAGAANPLVADVGCRNTVFNAVAQTGAEFVPRMKEMGIRHFRVELLRETPEQAAELLERYAQVLAGMNDGRKAWRQLKVLSQIGVTRGTLAD